MWDLATLQVVPGIRIAAPRDEPNLRELLSEAVRVEDRPTVLRFPKGSVGINVPAVRRTDDGVDILREDRSQQADDGGVTWRDVLIVGVGPMTRVALDVADLLAAQGITATVIDPRWVVPVPESVVDLARDHRLLISIEDGIRVGGIGTRIRQALRDAGVDTAVSELGTPSEFLGHATRAELLEETGLTAEKIAADVADQVHGRRIPVAKPEPAGHASE